MPKTITKTIELFTASELQTLHPQGFERALNDYKNAEQAEFSIKHNGLLEDFTNIARYMGFNDSEFEDSFQYSGFYSQGDGASFVATWTPSDIDVQALTAYAPNDTEPHEIQDSFERLKEALKGDDVERITMYRFGHQYSHENTVGLNFVFNGNLEPITFLNDHESMFNNCARRLMQYFYKRIETEYESLGDVHSFLDYALNNDVLFLENGDIYND